MGFKIIIFSLLTLSLCLGCLLGFIPLSIYDNNYFALFILSLAAINLVLLFYDIKRLFGEKINER